MNKLKKLMIAGATMALPALSFAASNVGDTADALGAQVNQVTNMMVIGGTLLGMVFLIIGGINLKKHGDNPQQVPLAKPLIFLAAGSLLFGLGSTSDVMQQTLFDGGREVSNDGTFDDF